jgi:hypothetical protein
VAPWGTSVALHLLLLLFLGLLVTVLSEPEAAPIHRIRGAMGEDITSLHEAEKPGDSFTTLQGPEPPSLSLEKNPSPDAVISVQKLPDAFVLGPSLNTEARREPVAEPAPTRPESVPKGPGRIAANARFTGESAGYFDSKLPLMAPFSGRSAEERARLIRREGGTVESEKAVEMGIEWIARHQRPDGGWSLETRPMCKGSPCPGDGPISTSDTAATGLALLPILGAGHDHMKPGKYQKTLERGLFWLVKMQKPSGEIYVGGSQHTLFYSHAIATMALCEAYGLTKDKRLRDPAQRAVFYINKMQNKADGGWRYQLGDPGDTSVFGWQIFALRSAHLAGLEVNRSVLKRARMFLDRVGGDGGASYSYLEGRPSTMTMTAEGLVCRQLMGWARDNPAMLAGTAVIADHLELSEERNIYYWYYATQLLHNMKNKQWLRWNARVREGLISMQEIGVGCERGSWSPSEPQVDRWGAMGGRLCVTSLSLLTLEVYYRYLPLYRDPGEEMAGSDRDPTETRPAR